MTIGVLGGGQLGRMLAQAGTPLGHSFVFFDPKADACAGEFGALVTGDYSDTAALEKFAAQVEVITYEFENLPLEAVQFLTEKLPVHPPLEALRITQDRILEKTLCRELDIPTANWIAVEKEEELASTVGRMGYPCILKTARMGYDGKGQIRLQSADDLSDAAKLVATQPCILEQSVSFVRELSIIGVRSAQGETSFYPLTENVHREGILRTSRAPALTTPELERAAQAIAEKMLHYFNYVGVLAIELFEDSNGNLLVNEMAPRVHNSGHWTIEGALTSQFENHVRAMSGMPLGSTEVRTPSVMVNVIGTFPPEGEWAQSEHVHVHRYGKAEKPNRKIGHITITHPDETEREALVLQVQAAMQS